MGNETDLVVKKRCTWATVLKILLIVAAVAFVAYKIYDKFFKKKKAAELEADVPDELEANDCGAEACGAADQASFEVSAQDVITNPESME